MDGYELAQRLCASLDARPHLVALTGYGSEREREASQRVGFDAHLVKPVDIANLERILDAARPRFA
jgi:CheY-like chemotaxis protein